MQYLSYTLNKSFSIFRFFPRYDNSSPAEQHICPLTAKSVCVIYAGKIHAAGKAIVNALPHKTCTAAVPVRRLHRSPYFRTGWSSAGPRRRIAACGSAQAVSQWCRPDDLRSRKGPSRMQPGEAISFPLWQQTTSRATISIIRFRRRVAVFLVLFAISRDGACSSVPIGRVRISSPSAEGIQIASMQKQRIPAQDGKALIYARRFGQAEGRSLKVIHQNSRMKMPRDHPTRSLQISSAPGEIFVVIPRVRY